MTAAVNSVREAPPRASTETTPWGGTFGASLSDIGGEVAELIRADRAREERSINMIASASYCPLALRQAEGTHLVNKNASGLPGRRSMANCEEVDGIENLAIERAKALFGAEAVNVQALSSTLANVAIMRAVLKPGDRLLAFGELAGGHVSHGADRHITSAGLVVRTFGVDGNDMLDLDAARRAALEFRPRMIVAGATSYPRAVDFRGLRAIADEVGALLFSDIAHVAGLVAAGLHDNPVPFSDVASSSTQKTLCGPRNGAFTFSRTEHAEAINAAIYPGLQGPVPIHIVAARAIQLELVARPTFRTLMEAVLANAQALAEGLKENGIPLYTGGTDTHMVIADLRTQEGWTPAELVTALGRYGVTGNGIRVPARAGDPNDAAYRFGSVAMTIRGVDVSTFRELGKLFGRVLAAGPKAATDRAVAARLTEIAEAHPVPSYVD